MSTVDDVETDLLEGLATYLAAQGVATYRQPGDPYLPDETAIMLGDLTPAPDRQIGLTIYGSQDSITENYSRYRVQIYMRGVPNDSQDANHLARDTFNAIQSLTSQQWGTAWLIQAFRNTFIPQGTDANLRAERADNYLLDVNSPATDRRS